MLGKLSLRETVLILAFPTGSLIAKHLTPAAIRLAPFELHASLLWQMAGGVLAAMIVFTAQRLIARHRRVQS